MVVTIRRATEADLPSIFEIYHEQVYHGVATFDTEPKTSEQQREWLAQHPPEYPALVACDDDGRVIGWATLSRWSPRRAYDRTAEVSEYVHVDLRGRGVGKRLLTAIIELARNQGRKVLLARIADANAGSVRFHEEAGFTTVGVMHGVGEKFGRILDVRIMEMQLN